MEIDIKNENAINNIKTSMAMENQVLSANEISVLRDFQNNRITMEQAMDIFKNMK